MPETISFVILFPPTEIESAKISLLFSIIDTDVVPAPKSMQIVPNNFSSSVNVDKEKDGKKTNVKIGISGIKVNKNGKDEVNIQFWPIFVFVAVLVSGFFFLIYKVVELIVRG